jgi:streptogramin lyase
VLLLALLVGTLVLAGPASAGSIGRITPAGAVTRFSAGTSSVLEPDQIAPGSDGNLWFSKSNLDYGSNARTRIARITPSGVITEFSAGFAADASVTGLALGPDGNEWFPVAHGTYRVESVGIGRMTPGGAMTEYPAGGYVYNPRRITAGPDAT